MTEDITEAVRSALDQKSQPKRKPLPRYDYRVREVQTKDLEAILDLNGAQGYQLVWVEDLGVLGGTHTHPSLRVTMQREIVPDEDRQIEGSVEGPDVSKMSLSEIASFVSPHHAGGVHSIPGGAEALKGAKRIESDAPSDDPDTMSGGLNLPGLRGGR